MSKKYASIINKINNGWSGQNLFISILIRYNYSNNNNHDDNGSLKFLKRSTSFGIGYVNPDNAQSLKWLNDINQSLYLYNKINKNIKKYILIITPGMNFN